MPADRSAPVDGSGRASITPQPRRSSPPWSGSDSTTRVREHSRCAGRCAGLMLRLLQSCPSAQLGGHDGPQLRAHHSLRLGNRIGKPSTIRGNHNDAYAGAGRTTRHPGSPDRRTLCRELRGRPRPASHPELGGAAPADQMSCGHHAGVGSGSCHRSDKHHECQLDQLASPVPWPSMPHLLPRGSILGG